MIVLGIETSCDETAAAVVTEKNGKIKVLSNIVSSQIKIHQKYGGVVPEVAAREHILKIIPVIDKALKKAKIITGTKLNPKIISHKLNAIAVTVGPGLISSLLVGTETAKTLSYVWEIPLVAVHHIEGHIYANFLNPRNIVYPIVALTVSGGHTMLIFIKKEGEFEIIGETRDDAAGEAFDKAAQLLGLGYPGGPIISREAQKYSNGSLPTLPRPMINSNDFDFSFSGLKTALRYAIEKDKNYKKNIPAYCYEVEQAIIDTLITKTIKAAKIKKANTIMLAGGVSANRKLRKQLKQILKKKLPNVNLILPNLKYTTDNAAMIAIAGLWRARKGKFIPWQKLKANPNLSIIN